MNCSVSPVPIINHPISLHLHSLTTNYFSLYMMKVGPRIVLITLFAFLIVGIYEGVWIATCEAVISLNGLNWALKLVDKKVEKEIMDRIKNIEEKVLETVYNWMIMIKDVLMAVVLGTIGMFGGKPFPPILEV